MDPISTAIVAALANISTTAVNDAYAALKSLIIKKSNESAAIPTAIASLESKPDSEARKAVLAEDIADSDILKDPEVVKAADRVTQEVQKVAPQFSGCDISQTVINSKNVAVSAAGSASVQVTES